MSAFANTLSPATPTARLHAGAELLGRVLLAVL